MGQHHLCKAAWLLPALFGWASTVSAQTPATGTPAMAAGQPRAEAAASATGAPAAGPGPTQASAQPAQAAAVGPAPAAASPALPAQPAPAAVSVVGAPPQQTQSTEEAPDPIKEKPAPRELPYYEGEPAPQGYRLVERPRRGLVVAGALTFGVPYAISVSVAAGGQYNKTSGWLLIPVVGPWITAAKIHDDHCDYSTGSCGDDAQAQRGLAAFDGIAQVAGATMLIVGLTLPRRLWVQDTVAELSVLPARIGREGYGLVGVGRF